MFKIVMQIKKYMSQPAYLVIYSKLANTKKVTQLFISNKIDTVYSKIVNNKKY